MSESIMISSPGKIDPALVNEIHNSNRIIQMDGKIKEVIDFLKNWKEEKVPPDEVISMAIEKLDTI